MLRVALPNLRLFLSPQKYSRGCTTYVFGLPTRSGISTNGTVYWLAFLWDVLLEDIVRGVAGPRFTCSLDHPTTSEVALMHM